MHSSPTPFVTTHPLRLAMLYGGASAEREVSLDSGREAISALRYLGHHVTPIDPGVDPLTDAQFLKLADWRRFDLAVLMLHGTFGEDGQIQTLFDQIALPYTGSSAVASRTAFFKSAAKECFTSEGVPTPPSVVLHEAEPREKARYWAGQIGYPLVVKPEAQGSSLGVSIVREESELSAALAESFRWDRVALAERYIAGEEWTVGFVDDIALPPMRVSTPRTFLDFEAKYRDEQTAVAFGDPADSAKIAVVQTAAAAARAAIGTCGISRVDVRVDLAGRPWVLEVNTLPGFTSHSAVPTAAAKIGISFPELCERLVRSAVIPAERSAAA